MVKICSTMEYKDYKAGDVVVEEGDKSNGKMYLVIYGIANILKRSEREVYLMEQLKHI